MQHPLLSNPSCFYDTLEYAGAPSWIVQISVPAYATDHAYASEQRRLMSKEQFAWGAGALETATNDLRYSSSLIYTDGLSCCNAVLLLGIGRETNGSLLGAIAHLSMETNPFSLFAGIPSRKIKGIKEMYLDPAAVRAVQISHQERACIGHDDIAAALQNQGILEENSTYLPVVSHPVPDNRIRRFAAMDVAKSEAYLFYENTPIPDVFMIKNYS